MSKDLLGLPGLPGEQKLDQVVGESGRVGDSEVEVMAEGGRIADMTAGARADALDVSTVPTIVDENLGRLLANSHSRCFFQGEEWKVSAEDNGVMLSVYASATETGREISFTILTDPNFGDDDDGGIIVTVCPSNMDKETVVQDFLAGITGIVKKSIVS